MVKGDALVHPYKWLGPNVVHPAPFFLVSASSYSRGSGNLTDSDRIDEKFCKAWLPNFCRSGQRETNLEEFIHEVHGWLPLFPGVSLPELTGEMLADVARRKGATAGSLDGWGWGELKIMPVSWFDGLARILSELEDNGVWLTGLLDAFIAMKPETDGDATPLGQRPLGVLPVVYRIWEAWGA